MAPSPTRFTLSREKHCETGIDYLYDNEDSVCGLIYNNTPYYFKKNLQGDVIQIVNETGLPVANYSYDAWGVCTVTSDNTATDDFVGIAAINPIRYRGYYYDTETKIYYVSSRYYNPYIGRFINSDETLYLGFNEPSLGFNLFSYCFNSVSNYSDPMGTSPIQILLAAIFGLVGYAIGDHIARGCGLSPSGRGSWKYWILRSAVAIGGAALGWFAGSLVIKLAVDFIAKNPRILLSLAVKKGAPLIINILWVLGINPLSMMDKSLMMGFLNDFFNKTKLTLPSSWAESLVEIANKFGLHVELHSPHLGNAWCFPHLKINNLHVRISEEVFSLIKKLLEGG